MDNKISSFSNPNIRRLNGLSKNSQLRKKEGVFVVEGAKEVNAALASGFKHEMFFICRDFFTDKALEKKIQKFENAEKNIVFEVSKAVYESVAYRESSQGIIATFYSKENILEDIKLSANPLVIVLESVEKPGNLGAVLRTADASGADAVIICDPLVDIYNPNVIRSGVGCLFYQQIAVANSADTIKWLKSNKVKIFATALPATKMYYDFNFKKSAAIVMGSEAHGLSKEWFDGADELIKIPMLGKTDSLNVSTSAAIVVFEVVRQRNI